MSESALENQTNNSEDTPHIEESDQKEKPTRKSKTRLSLAERAAKESQEILKSMGVKESGDESGRRRTRSSMKPATVAPATPPPAKKERKTPVKAEKKDTIAKGSTKGRGRGRRGSKKDEEEEEQNNKDHESDEKNDENKVDNKNDESVTEDKDEKMEVDEPKPQGEKTTEENGQLEDESKVEEQSSKNEEKEEKSKEEKEDKKEETTNNENAPQPAGDVSSQADANKTNE